MEKANLVHVEYPSDSHAIRASAARNKSLSALPTEWPPPDQRNEDAATAKSISPLQIFFSPKRFLAESSTSNHNIKDEWKKLQMLRAHIRTIRDNMERLGDRIRQIQAKQLEADNIYLSLVRRKHVTGEVLDGEIEHAFERLEAFRSEYSEADIASQSLREPLRASESGQMRMEHRFYKHLEKLSQSSPETRSHWSRTSTTSSARSFRNYGPEKTYHPLFDHYLSKLGVVERLHEEFADLENWKVGLEDEREVRKRVGKTLLSDDEEFLLNFPVEAGKLLASLEIAQANAEKAKFTCIEAGVWRDASSSDGESISNEEYDALDGLPFNGLPADQSSKIVENQESREQEREKGNPISLERAFKFSGIASSRSPTQILKTTQNNSSVFSDGFLEYIWDKKTSAGDFVNLWLLHKLQSSLVEFGLLFREAETCRILAGDSVWQANVASRWLDDGTSDFASATVTDHDTTGSMKAPDHHPFINWNTIKDPYLPKTTAEVIGGSLLAKHFDSFVYSAPFQTKGLLLSTTELPLQQVDFANFFLLENKTEQTQEAKQESEEPGKLPDMIFLGHLPYSSGTREVYLMENMYRNLRLAC